MKTDKLPQGVKQNPINPEPIEIIAQAIIDVANGFKVLNSSRLSRRTIVLLLQDATGLPQKQIGLILDAAPRLAETYLKKEDKR